MQNNESLSESDINRIIEMAWEDRTTFDAIESQYGLKEQKVKELMREHLKSSSYKLWRKRVYGSCLLYTSPSPRDRQKSRMPSSA